LEINILVFDFSLENVFVNIDGKLLSGLYKMKKLTANSYYTFLDKHIDQNQMARMSDTLKFDNELECLFQ
jgi:hypothetical protein